MNPADPSSGRDLFAEVDEIITTMRTVLRAVGNMGEELLKYRTAWRDLAPQVDSIGEISRGHLQKLEQLSQEAVGATQLTISTLTAMEERLSLVESGYGTLSQFLLNIDERLKALENGYRLIVP